MYLILLLKLFVYLSEKSSYQYSKALVHDLEEAKSGSLFQDSIANEQFIIHDLKSFPYCVSGEKYYGNGCYLCFNNILH